MRNRVLLHVLMLGCTLGLIIAPVASAAATQPAQGGYVALGDSVASGAGLSTPENPSLDPLCDRSGLGYPQALSRSANIPVTDVTCSGANAANLITGQAVDGTVIPPQVQTAFAERQPTLVTLTAGANDAHWAEIVTACYTTDCTQPRYEYAARAYLFSMRLKLETSLNYIKRLTADNPHPPLVVLTGYYNPFSAACSATRPQLTPAELSWLNSQLIALNKSIKEVSDKYPHSYPQPFTRYVTIGFGNHDICSADPWVQNEQSPAPFHPTAHGQKVIAEEILAALQEGR